eukprot:9121966-Karenia_brevis.AAC.1
MRKRWEVLNDLSNGQIAYLQKRMKEEYDTQYPPGLAAAAPSDTPVRWGEDNIKRIAEALYQPNTAVPSSPKASGVVRP